MALQPRPYRRGMTNRQVGVITHHVHCTNFTEPDFALLAEHFYKLIDGRGPYQLGLDFTGVDFVTAGALGMLLTLSKKLQALGGRLVVYNVSSRVYEVFEITKLHLVLDVRRAGQATDLSGQLEPRTGEAVSRVLIVEDNRDTALTLKRLLESEGRETDIASDGEEALRRLPDFDPHVLLLDLGLPRLDGYQVAARIRSMGDAEIRIIAVTGHGEPESLYRAKVAGVDHFMVKPVDPKRLMDLVVGSSRG